MTISNKVYDTTGNHEILDGVQLSYDTMTNVAIPAATQPSIVAGTGAPTFSAIKGTLYINLTGSTTITRLYINTTGSTTWTPFTAGA
jgi:hypothetical protein